MALDEPKENDIKIEKNGITFVVSDQLANYLPYVTVGYRNSWLGKGLYVDTSRTGC